MFKKIIKLIKLKKNSLHYVLPSHHVEHVHVLPQIICLVAEERTQTQTQTQRTQTQTQTQPSISSKPRISHEKSNPAYKHQTQKQTHKFQAQIRETRKQTQKF